ncbi:MAG: LysR family transcriptional regulator [Pseudomonadota bacterium]
MTLRIDNMQGLILFAHIYRQGSLSGAAQLLGISRSSVSKQLAALEHRIGSRLLHRSTRRIRLTDVGRHVLEEAHQVELALQRIEQVSERAQTKVSGHLNVTCASAQGREHLIPLLSAFYARYPDITVNVQLEDRLVDMLMENIDVSIRIGYLPDSSLIARKLAELSGVICASPEYLKQAPPLNSAKDLLNHRCLFYRNAKRSMNTWTLVNEQGEDTITVSGPLSVNDPSALVSVAEQHGGVLLVDRSLLGDRFEQGTLVPVLQGYQSFGNLPMYVVYPEREYIPAKTRAFVDFVLEHMPARLAVSDW